MSAPSKIEQLREMKGRLPQAALILAAMASVIALLAFGPVIPQPALWHFVVPPPAPAPAKVQPWVGYLENPALTDPSAGTKPLTSASYTSGFDKAAAGLVPRSVPPAKTAQTRDPRTCPDGLNCSFRTASVAPPRRPPDAAPSGVAPSLAAVGAPPPPDAGDLPPADVGPPAASPPPPRPSGLAIRLPSPHTLLRPFAFVANTFTGFIKKL